MSMITYSSLFIERSVCILYTATMFERGSAIGWIGGTAPMFFDTPQNSNSLEHYTFYLTFQNPLNPRISISVFLPKDYDRYAEDDRYPDLPIKVLEHPTTEAGILQDLSSPSLNKCYIEMSRVCTSEVVDTPYLIKLGGFPVLIQDKERYYRALEQDGFTFMFQVDENGYPEELVNGNYPFNFGCFYAYALFKSDCFSELTAGFWQFS